MHPLLAEGSKEASRLYDSIVDARLDWSTLRVSTLPRGVSSAEFLKVLKNGTRVVSVSGFKSAFAEAVKSFKAMLGDRRWFTVVDEEEPRSLYFFLLALEVCPDLARNLHGILKLPRGFVLSDSFTDFVYAYFDDMVSSGCTIESSLKPVSSMPRVVVAPFVGEVAKEFLGNIGVTVVGSKVVLPFVKIDPSRSNAVDFKYDAYPIVFSHRTLKDVEGFPEVYQKIRVGAVADNFPAKNTYSRYEYLVRDIVDKFVS